MHTFYRDSSRDQIPIVLKATGQVDGETLNSLTRRTAGNLNLVCQFTGGPCASIGAVLPKAYTFVGDSGI